MLTKLYVAIIFTFPIWLYGNTDLKIFGPDSVIIDDNVPRLGYSLASGDFNNDGYDDVVVGYRGGLYLYYGSSFGLGVQSFDTLSSVPKAIEPEIIDVGDINGDGYLDIMVAGREYSLTDNPKREGIVYLYYNDNGSFDDSPIYFYHRDAFSKFSHFLPASPKIGACLGDVNGDDYDDIVISIYSNAFGYYTFIYYGSSEKHVYDIAGIDMVNDHDDAVRNNYSIPIITTPMSGDFDGDGYDDIIFKYRHNYDILDYFSVLNGSDSGLVDDVNGTSAFIQIDYDNLSNNWIGSLSDNWIGSFAIEDANRDGYDDFIFVSVDGMVSKLHFHSGSPDGLSGISSWSKEYSVSSMPSSIFSVIPISIEFMNIDKDDGSDMILRFYDRIYVHSYDTSDASNDLTGGYSPIPVDTLYFGYGEEFVLSSSVAYSGSKNSIVSGDVNGDGFDDLIVGLDYYKNLSEEDINSNDGLVSPNDWRGSLWIYKSPYIISWIEDVSDSGFTIAWDGYGVYDSYDIGLGVGNMDEILYSFSTDFTNYSVDKELLIDSYVYYCRSIGVVDSEEYSTSMVNTIYYSHIDSITSISPSSFVINWSLVPDVDGYVVDVSSVPDFSSIILSDTIGPIIDSLYVDDLYHGKRYYSRIRYLFVGDNSMEGVYYYDDYDSMSVMTSSIDWLLLDTLEDVLISDTFISINWSDVGIEEFGCYSCEFVSKYYIVELSYDTIVDSIISITNIVDTFHSFVDLVPGLDYHYRILGIYTLNKTLESSLGIGVIDHEAGHEIVHVGHYSNWYSSRTLLMDGSVDWKVIVGDGFSLSGEVFSSSVSIYEMSSHSRSDLYMRDMAIDSIELSGKSLVIDSVDLLDIDGLHIFISYPVELLELHGLGYDNSVLSGLVESDEIAIYPGGHAVIDIDISSLSSEGLLLDLYFRSMDDIAEKVESEFSIDSIVFNDRVLLPYSIIGDFRVVGFSSEENFVGDVDDIDIDSMDVSNDIDSVDVDNIDYVVDSVDDGPNNDIDKAIDVVDSLDDDEVRNVIVDSVDYGGNNDVNKAIIDLLDSGFVDIETGLLDVEEISIIIYPNPMSDRFHIRIDGSYSGLVLCNVYNIDGRLFLSESLMKIGDVLDINMGIGSLEIGVYVIEIVMGDKKERYKVVKN